MTSSKKTAEDIIKDVRSNISELSKSIEIAKDSTKIIMIELIEYFKQRNEIENAYAKNLSNLCEKFKGRIAKVSQLFNYSENGLKRTTETFCLLKTIESELKSRSKATVNLSNTIESLIIPISKKYIVFHEAKVEKEKEILDYIEKNLIQVINDVFTKRNEYEKTFKTELKSSKELEELKSKLIKSKKSFDTINEKIKKHSPKYKNEMIQTDKCRNEYLLAHYSTKCCLERLFSQQAKEIVLFFNIKFGDFWKFYAGSFIGALTKFNDSVATSIKMFDGLCFSDEKETDLIIDRYTEKLSEKNIFMPLLLSKSDAINKIMLNKSLKPQFEKGAIECMDSIKLMLLEIKKKTNYISDIKNSDIQWDKDFIELDETKEAKNLTSHKQSSPSTFFDYEEYFNKVDEYVKLDCVIYYNKMRYDRMVQILLNYVDTRSSILRLDAKDLFKRMEFGVDLVEYYRIFDINIPAVISICVEHLYSHNLLENWEIFIGYSSLKELTEAKDILINTGKVSDTASATCVATIMYEYIRSLKNFINYENIPNKIEHISILSDEEFIYETKRWLVKLPKSSRNLIVYLSKFIKHISKNFSDNKTNINTLCATFSKVIFCPDFSEKNGKLQQNLTYFLRNISEKIYQICPNEPVLFEIDKIQQEEFDNEKIILIDPEPKQQFNLFTNIENYKNSDQEFLQLSTNNAIRCTPKAKSIST